MIQNHKILFHRLHSYSRRLLRLDCVVHMGCQLHPLHHRQFMSRSSDHLAHIIKCKILNSMVIIRLHRQLDRFNTTTINSRMVHFVLKTSLYSSKWRRIMGLQFLVLDLNRVHRLLVSLQPRFLRRRGSLCHPEWDSRCLLRRDSKGQRNRHRHKILNSRDILCHTAMNREIIFGRSMREWIILMSQRKIHAPGYS